METLIFQPESQEQLKALKISFKTEEKPYNPEFIAKIKKSQEDFEVGKGRVIPIDELNSSITGRRR